MYLLEDVISYSRPTLNIDLAPHQSCNFRISIVNNSPINFGYYWALKTSREKNKGKKMDPNWITISHNTRYIPSFSTTDMVVHVTPETHDEQKCYIYLSLYLKNIPIRSVKSDLCIIRKNESEDESEEAHDDFQTEGDDSAKKSEDEFEEAHDDFQPEAKKSETEFEEAYDDFQTEDDDSSNTLFKTIDELVDVHIFDLEISCNIKYPSVQPEVVETAVSAFREDETRAGLTLSKTVLNFGILPKGVKISKSFFVENLTDDSIHWKLIEIKCNSSEFYISPETENINHFSGTLKRNSKRKIIYTVVTKDCFRWVSILSLFSCPRNCDNHFLDSVCLITYQVVEYKITLRADNNKPIISPKENLYLGIPYTQSIYVHNGGVLNGCFYFLKPRGTNVDHINIKLNPQSGVVAPNDAVEVKIELVGLQEGIFDDIYVPCFVGDLEYLIGLTIICTVSNISVYFYLPDVEGGYNKILWPPTNNLPHWNYPIDIGEDSGQCLYSSQNAAIKYDDSFMCLIANDSVAATYPTVKTKSIPVKKPTKITFYVENLTPLHGHFTVNPVNYGPESSCVNNILVKAGTRTPEFFLEKVCSEGYGIVVETVRPSGDIVPYEVVEIDLYIYANTWGKYLEEIMVEINDLTPFCFNLVIEIVGLPIEFPFARNTTLSCPTIRFQNVAYPTNSVTKGFTITNISAIPVQISWHVFTSMDHCECPFNVLLDFDEPKRISAKSFKHEACGRCISVKPNLVSLEKQSTKSGTVTIVNNGLTPADWERMDIEYQLIGYITIDREDQFKENYFKRRYGTNLSPLKLKILLTLELPVLQMELSSDETTIDIFVNDILLTDYKFPETYLLIRNLDISTACFKIQIEKPFKIIEIRTVPTGITDKKCLVLESHECLQMMVTCYFSREDIFQYAEQLYGHNAEGVDNTENFVSVISKNLSVYQSGIPRQVIPFQVRLHFPHIEVTPDFIKFGYCLLYNSKKTIFTIYNLTGSVVNFEIFKSVKYDAFEVYPNRGQIARSTGCNKQFVDVAVYFSPKHCKLYLESLRILTNIQQYYIDLPLSGHGTNDEKFTAD